MIDYFPDEFYETLGEAKPGTPFGLLDQYRFDLVYRHLVSGSVLDVGAYYADFLKLARRNGRQVFGAEINMDRVDLANSRLGEKAVVLDSRNGRLDLFEDDSVDNVVCMEVIEHQPDDRFAISELCRVARSKVIVSVPFEEQIRKMICLHCFQHTPYSGHLHSYELGTFSKLVPSEWWVTMERPFAGRVARGLSLFLPKNTVSVRAIGLIDSLFPRRARWLLVTLEPSRPLRRPTGSTT